MYLKGKKIAVAGLSLALTEVLLVLSSMIEMNTLFFLAAASFFVGIMIREFDLRMGLAFYIAAILLGILLAPNKIYCITFAALGFYILAVEAGWRMLGRHGKIQNRNKIFWIGKYLIFNVMYLPMLLFVPKLIYAGDMHPAVYWGLFAAGQAVLWIYDKAYEYFQAQVWGKFRGRLGL